MNSRIIVNGTDLELSDVVTMPFNYLVSDIREPERKQANYSKTINIPATKANNLLFSNIYRIDKQINSASYTTNFAPDFNPNLKASAIVYINDIEIFSGNIQLLKINLKDKKPFDYEVILIGELSNIFYDMGESYLHSLDLSEYSHNWTRTNITESWATRIQKNGANYVNFSGGLPIGEGYVYSLIDYGKNNGQSYKVTDLFPAIYAKTYIDKIFSRYGYTYTSSFFSSALFKKLIVPFNKKGLALNQADLNSRKFRVGSAITDTNPSGATDNILTVVNNLFSPVSTSNFTNIKFTNELTAPNQDLNNLYDNNTASLTYGQYINHTNGYYNLNFHITQLFNFNLIPTDGEFIPDSVKNLYDTDSFYTKIASSEGTLEAQIKIKKYTALTGLTTTIYTSSLYTLDLSSFIYSNALLYSSQWRPDMNEQINSQIPPNNIDINLTNIQLKVGDRISVQLQLNALDFKISLQGYYLNNTYNNITKVDPSDDKYFYASCFIKALRNTASINDYFYNDPLTYSLFEGDSIDINVCIPLNIKQKDFLSSIIKMFNLYVDVDKTNPSNLLIETREQYYTNDVIDWTDKVDMTNMFEVTPMGDLNSKVYNYKSTPDNDHYNERYKLLYNETYGDLKLDVNNDFIRGENTTQIIFSDTVAVGSTLHDRVIPCFVEYDVNNLVTTVTDLSVKKPKETNIRLLHYSGLKSTNQNFLITSVDTTTVSYSTYPFANHIDSATAPTLDLNWSAPIELSYTSITYTNNNLFNKYWSGFISEITDANSKLISAMFYLKPTDILTLDFKKLYLIDGNYFRLNKILDYDPLSNNLTKVELIKTKTASPFVGQSVPIIPTITSYNYIEGGQDEVRDIGATSYYNLIEGGLDEVRDIGATAITNFINGGLNNI